MFGLLFIFLVVLNSDSYEDIYIGPFMPKIIDFPWDKIFSDTVHDVPYQNLHLLPHLIFRPHFIMSSSPTSSNWCPAWCWRFWLVIDSSLWSPATYPQPSTFFTPLLRWKFYQSLWLMKIHPSPVFSKLHRLPTGTAVRVPRLLL